LADFQSGFIINKEQAGEQEPLLLSNYKRRISMHSQTYKDIIDDKIGEWQQGLERLGKMVEKASVDQKDQLSAKVEEFKSTIEAAITQLRDLDAQETVHNTIETKEKILNIFSSIDKDFGEYQEKTPFML
jgi:hypothetical protein